MALLGFERALLVMHAIASRGGSIVVSKQPVEMAQVLNSAVQRDVRNGHRGTREQISVTLNDSGHALRRWLGAQLIAMIIVGTLIGVGLAVVGVPSALALGMIAGVAEFVPIIGPVIGAIPALLLASTESFEMVLWTLAVFVVVQQVESNIIMPIVAGRAVELPPAVGLLVPGSQKGNSLFLPPYSQGLQLHISAGGPAISGVHVKIGDKPHIYSFGGVSPLSRKANRLIAFNFSPRPILAVDSACRRTSMDRS